MNGKVSMRPGVGRRVNHFLIFAADDVAGSNGARVGEQAEVGGRIATSYRGEGRGTTYRHAHAHAAD